MLWIASKEVVGTFFLLKIKKSKHSPRKKNLILFRWWQYFRRRNKKVNSNTSNTENLWCCRSTSVDSKCKTKLTTITLLGHQHPRSGWGEMTHPHRNPHSISQTLATLQVMWHLTDVDVAPDCAKTYCIPPMVPTPYLIWHVTDGAHTLLNMACHWWCPHPTYYGTSPIVLTPYLIRHLTDGAHTLLNMACHRWCSHPT